MKFLIVGIATALVFSFGIMVPMYWQEVRVTLDLLFGI
jgi:hypothetical protein